MMAEKPILFSTEMVKAILEGRKTQARRVMKPQPVFEYNYWWYDETSFRGEDDLQDYLFHNVYGDGGSPYGGVYGDGTSDTLWVRETWATPGNYDHIKPSELSLTSLNTSDIAYRASEEYQCYYNWRPSIFMPRWISRITLNVVDVRVERLQEINNGEVFLEGIEECLDCDKYILSHRNGELHDQMDDFKRLWNSINSKRGYGWDTNPWVWVISFEQQPKTQ